MNGKTIKRLISVIVCVMVMSVAYSQTSSHMEFLGIPINGSSHNFLKRLESKGFVQEGNHYTGVFIKRKVMVGPLIENGVFYGVHIAFTDLDTQGGCSYFAENHHMPALADMYGMEFSEYESSNPDVPYIYNAVNEVGWIMVCVQYVNEYYCGIDVQIIDIDNARRSGFFN